MRAEVPLHHLNHAVPKFHWTKSTSSSYVFIGLRLIFWSRVANRQSGNSDGKFCSVHCVSTGKCWLSPTVPRALTGLARTCEARHGNSNLYRVGAFADRRHQIRDL